MSTSVVQAAAASPAPPPLPDGQERELKLAVPPAAAEQVRRSRPVRLLKRGRALTRQLRSVYFDTADLVLRDHGMSLRVRHIGARRVQTVKSAADHSLGLSVRREWECDIDGDAPDLAAIGDADLRDALVRLLLQLLLQRSARAGVQLHVLISHGSGRTGRCIIRQPP